MIITSLNIKKDIFAVISRTAARLKKSRRDVVVILLMQIMRDIDTHQGGFTSVNYQSDDPAGEWHCFSLRLKPDEYEFFFDLRKLCKCSVSLLVALAVKEYLEGIPDETSTIIYKKVRFENYIIHREVINKIICWRIYWGMPEGYAEPAPA